MSSIKVQIDEDIRELTSPETVDEFTQEQFVLFVKNFLIHGEMTTFQHFEMLIALLGLEKKQAQKIMDGIVRGGYFPIIEETCFGFLQKKIETSRWFIQELKTTHHIFYGPRDGFSYMTFGEFISLDIMYSHYLDMKNRERPTDYQFPTNQEEREKRTEVLSHFINENKHALNIFCAAIMRPLWLQYPYGSSKDRRIEFDSDMIEARALIFEDVPAAEKLAIVHNYALVRSSIVQAYPLAFDTTEGEKKENTGSAAENWLEIRSRLAGSVLNLSKVDELLLSDVLSSIKPQRNDKS